MTKGRVVSSGHFRNEFDRLGPAVSGTTLGACDHRRGSVSHAGDERYGVHHAQHRFRLVGGIAVDSPFLARLARDPELGVALALPRDSTRSDSGKLIVGPPLTLPYNRRDGRSGAGRSGTHRDHPLGRAADCAGSAT